MVKSRGGTPAARTLGAELRDHRNQVNMSTRSLAERMDVDRSRIMRWETGRLVPTEHEVAHYLGALHVAQREIERLTSLAAEAADSSDWLTSGAHGRGFHQELTTLVEYERTASRITEVAPLVIPGLLQTREYTRALLIDQPWDQETRLQLRMDRRKILSGKKPTELHAFIGEGVMHEPIGGHAVLAEQLDHLLNIDKPWVQLHVIPSGSTRLHLAHHGQFVFCEFPKAAPIVHLEHYASASFLSGAKAISTYQQALESLREMAMSPDDSLERIAEIRKEMKE